MPTKARISKPVRLALVGFRGVEEFVTQPGRRSRHRAGLFRVGACCARIGRSRGRAAACPARCPGASAARFPWVPHLRWFTPQRCVESHDRGTTPTVLLSCQSEAHDSGKATLDHGVITSRVDVAEAYRRPEASTSSASANAARRPKDSSSPSARTLPVSLVKALW